MTTEREALTKVRDWLADPRLETWPYMENGPFYDDLAEMLAMLNAALAQPTAPQYASPEDYARQNPLGGVARVFEVIAERLRQGEDYDYVLWDYGLQRAAIDAARGKP